MAEEENGLLDTVKKGLDSVSIFVGIVVSILAVFNKKDKNKKNGPIARLDFYGGHYDLYLGKNKIGRVGSHNNISINDFSVSREHAVIECFSTGVVVLEDSGSKNGTFVNSKSKITRPIELTDGVEVIFGTWSATFKFY